MKNFSNKLVVITGAASGIGKALACHFAKAQARLILMDNHAENLQKVQEELGTQVLKTYCFDVGSYEAFIKVAQEIKEEFGGADVVINNAGVALGKMTAEETSMDDFHWLMNINFWGMVNGSKAFLPQLKEKQESVLVNVSSLFGQLGIGFQSAYCSSKFAIRGFTESLIAENEHKGLSIHVVHPGGIKTQISLNARGGKKEHNEIFHDKFLKNSPDFAARVIVKGIRAKRKRISVGSDAHFGNFVARFIPLSLINYVQKSIYKDLD